MIRARLRPVVAVLALATALALGACGHPSSSATSTPQATQTAGAEASSSSQATPKVERDGSANFPRVTGAFGSAPRIAKGSGTKPTSVSVKTLSRGKGRTVGTSDVIVANYALQLWGGKAVESSFTSGQPAVLDMSQMVSGWRFGVAGSHVGDRLELVVPPQYAYGSQSTSAVPANSELVFVVDVIDAVDPSDTAQLRRATPTHASLPAGLSVRGSRGTRPTIAFSSGAREPTKASTVVLDQGRGPAASKSQYLVCQIVAAYWGDARSAQSTWGSAPQVLPASAGGLSGVRVGSRIVLLYPKSAAASSASPSASPSTQPATVLVVDVVGALRAS